MFSVATLTEEEALLIADAYFRGEKDPPKMARILGVDQFDLNILMHPFVRRKIVQLQRQMEVSYGLREHAEQLKTIRDAAFADDNFKVALQAETQLGKAVGIYEQKLPGDGDGDGNVDPLKLSSDELRRRLAKMIGAVVPNPPEEASQLLELSDDSDDEDFTV